MRKCETCGVVKLCAQASCDACIQREYRQRDPGKRVKPHRCKACGVLIATRICLECLAADKRKETTHV